MPTQMSTSTFGGGVTTGVAQVPETLTTYGTEANLTMLRFAPVEDASCFYRIKAHVVYEFTPSDPILKTMARISRTTDAMCK